MKNLTTIAITKDVKTMLDSMGTKSETYNELISRLIAAAEKSEFFERQKAILRSEKFISVNEI